MGKNINSSRVSCLLYLDDPEQASLADYMVDLSPSRKGEDLRKILKMGWNQFKKEMHIDEDPEELAKQIKKRQEKKRKSKADQTAPIKEKQKEKEKNEKIEEHAPSSSVNENIKEVNRNNENDNDADDVDEEEIVDPLSMFRMGN